MKIKMKIILAFLLLPLLINAQIDRSAQPKSGHMPKINLGESEHFTLANGLRVIMVENHKLPKVTLSLTIDNKPVSEGGKAGLSDLMGDLLGTGTTNISKDDFEQTVDYLGANVNFDSNSASLSCLKRYFPKVLELMADGVKNPVFTQKEFDKKVKFAIENSKVDENDVSTISGRVGDALIYGKNHPFGEFTTSKTLKNITLADVKNNYNTYYRPNNAYIAVIGDIKPSEVKKLITQNFKDWKSGNIPVSKLIKPQNVSQTEIDFIDMPNAVQSRIDVMNNVNLKLSDDDYYAALLANNILGGSSTSRLFMNLREDKAYTYGAYSGLSQSRYAGLFKAGASVRNSVTDSAVVEIRKEINRIVNKKVSEQELKNAKAKYVGNFVMSLERPSTTAEYAINIMKYNLPKDFYKNYLAKINAVTVDDVQKAASKYFKSDNQRIVITGKGADVLKNLEKTTHYKINYFDKQAKSIQKPMTKIAVPKGVNPTAVIDAYFKAIGGMPKVATIKTVWSIYKAQIQGVEMELEIKQASPNKQAILVSSMGNVMQKTVFDGDKGYDESRGNRSEIKDKELERMKVLSAPFVDLTYKKGTLKGIESIGGKKAYVILYKDTEVFYDVDSGLKLKAIQTAKSPRGDMKIVVEYFDYKAVNGVKFPYTIGQTMGSMKIEFKATQIKVNQGITDADFK